MTTNCLEMSGHEFVDIEHETFWPIFNHYEVKLKSREPK